MIGDSKEVVPKSELGVGWDHVSDLSGRTPPIDNTTQAAANSLGLKMEGDRDPSIPLPVESLELVKSASILAPATNEEIGCIILPWLTGSAEQKCRKLKKAVGACKYLSGLTFGKAVLRKLFTQGEFAGVDGNDRRLGAMCHLDCRDMGKPDFAEYFPIKKDPARSRMINIFAEKKPEPTYAKRAPVCEGDPIKTPAPSDVLEGMSVPQKCPMPSLQA